jgi:hypothetical protein
MKTTTAWLAAAALFTAACGAEPGAPGGSTADLALAAEAGVAPTGPSDPAAAYAGTYSGRMVLPYGKFTWSMPVEVEVSSPGPGLVRVPLGDICLSVDQVDIAPPEALVIVLSRPDAWSFLLPTGEQVRLGSVQLTFGPDGTTLTIVASGTVENGDPLEWTFVGTR